MRNRFREIIKGPVGWVIKATLLALLPVLCCVITCAAKGYRITDAYLPASEWNDELFYFKQVEAILEYGYPYGYFGFNESHALKLSFAAWSPILVFPWVLWGGLFDWNLLSPVWCNLFLISVAIFVFVLLVKPSGKKLGILAILYCLFPLFTRYILSGMPEIICFSMVILFYGVAFHYLQSRQSRAELLLLFVMSMVMTWMRPYLVVMVLLPIFLWIKRSRKWWSVAGSAGILAITAGVYGAISYYLSAEYLTPLFETGWITTFFEKGLFAGIKYMLGTLWYQSHDFWARVIESFRSGLAEGAFFSAFLAVLLLLILQTVISFRKKEEIGWIICGHGVISFVGMWMALLLMYRMKDGSKHLLTFVVAGTFMISMMNTRFFKKAAFLAVTFVFFFFIQAKDPYDYQIPFASSEREEEMQYWQEIFDEELLLETEDVPNYDNVIIWVFSDRMKPEGELILTKWQPYYAVPEGMGISCCYSEYIAANLPELKSKYLGTLSGGEIDRMCTEAGYREIGRDNELVVYVLR